MRDASMTNTVLHAYRLTKARRSSIRIAALGCVAQRSASYETSPFTEQLSIKDGARKTRLKPVSTENISSDISDDILREAFNVTVEKIFDALSPSAFDLELKNADKKHLFFSNDTLASAFTAKYESIKHFHEQGLFFKEFLYRVRKKKRQVEK